MKKIIAIAFLFAASLSVSAQSHPKWPFGVADTYTIAATGATTVTVANNVTIIDAATTQLTGNSTINLAVNKNTTIGTVIYVKSATVATQTLTFGTGFVCPTLTGVAGKTFCTEFWYDGTNFLPQGAPYQIN